MDRSEKIAIGIMFASVSAVMLMKWRDRQKHEQYINTLYDMQPNVYLPRGYRNNNPLNIRKSANLWKGKVYNNTDGAFEQFVSLPYGYRAALATMRTYIRKYGLNTVAKIIGRWAPENENNTSKYIADVCSIANLTPDTIVARNSKDILTRMAYAMSIIENGTKEIGGQYRDLMETYGLPNMDIINEGWELL